MIPIGVDIPPGADFLYEKTVKGSTLTRIDIPRYLDLYRRGRVKLDDLVGRIRPLEAIGVAMDDLDRGAVARSVITFDGRPSAESYRRATRPDDRAGPESRGQSPRPPSTEISSPVTMRASSDAAQAATAATSSAALWPAAPA